MNETFLDGTISMWRILRDTKFNVNWEENYYKLCTRISALPMTLRRNTKSFYVDSILPLKAGVSDIFGNLGTWQYYGLVNRVEECIKCGEDKHS